MFCLAKLTVISQIIFQDWLVSRKYNQLHLSVKSVPHSEITNVQLDIRHKVIQIQIKTLLDHKSLNEKKNYHILVNVSI